MLIAFAGTHIPLLALIGFFVSQNATSLEQELSVLAVALAATLAGTGLTLLVLNADLSTPAARAGQIAQALGTGVDAGDIRFIPELALGLALFPADGAEALLRWNHPERGLLAPGAFIGVAEDSGLIDPMSRWVLEAACRQMGEWAGTELAAPRVSVNLSARQFADEAIARQIGDALQRRAIALSRLEIELTETAAARDSKMTHCVLSLLREMGVSAAIDDFGTGYSSLSYLMSLPFDKLKIDRAFIQHVDARPKSLAIWRVVVELARGLDIEVLAEGTETAAEIAQLNALGCDLYQGFFLAKPMPVEALSGAIAGSPDALGHDADRGSEQPGAWFADAVAVRGLAPGGLTDALSLRGDEIRPVCEHRPP